MGINDFQAKLVAIQPNMMSYAFALTLHRDDAHDLVQDTVLKALDNQEKFSSDLNFKGWVFTIMRNIFINNYRRNSKIVLSDDMPNFYENTDSLPASIAITPECLFTLNEINSTIASLPEVFRTPFALHVAGYKYEEIAQKMKLPIGTVKSRIFTARVRLQKLYANSF